MNLFPFYEAMGGHPFVYKLIFLSILVELEIWFILSKDLASQFPGILTTGLPAKPPGDCHK